MIKDKQKRNFFFKLNKLKSFFLQIPLIAFVDHTVVLVRNYLAINIFGRDKMLWGRVETD